MYLLDTNILRHFDEGCANAMEELQRKYKPHKQHADMMIAAVAIAGNHIVVTHNQKHFAKFLPSNQTANWIDEKPA